MMGGKMQIFFFKVKRKLGQWWMLVCYLFAWSLKGLFSGKEKYKNLWIVSERGVDARDNAYWMFRYIKRHHPEYNVRFIISRDSPDRKKVEREGEVINYKSFSHYLAIALAEVKISSHIMGFTPETYFFTRVDKMGIIPGKKIFLQHGIIKDDITFLHHDSTQPDLFVCGARREAEYVQEHYGYPEGIVRWLGLCRYDNLALRTGRDRSRMILLMPTWRLYFGEYSEKEFMGSGFFQTMQAFLQSEKLADLLKRYDYRLVFYPHHDLQWFLSCFAQKKDRDGVGGAEEGRSFSEQKNSSEDVVSFASEREDLQRLLIEADVLITDYSSVFFDFAYMEKPIIYYQFDRDEYRKGHYQEGYFSYDRDGFGRVTFSQEETLEELERILERGAEVEPVYLERMDRFFERRDRDNCRRNWEAILDVVSQSGKEGGQI